MKNINNSVINNLSENELQKYPVFVMLLSEVTTYNGKSIVLTYSRFYNKTKRFKCYPYYKHIFRI